MYFLHVFIILLLSMVFVGRPTNQTSVAQGLFKVGPSAWPYPSRAWHSEDRGMSRRRDTPDQIRADDTTAG